MSLSLLILGIAGVAVGSVLVIWRAAKRIDLLPLVLILGLAGAAIAVLVSQVTEHQRMEAAAASGAQYRVAVPAVPRTLRIPVSTPEPLTGGAAPPAVKNPWQSRPAPLGAGE